MLTRQETQRIADRWLRKPEHRNVNFDEIGTRLDLAWYVLGEMIMQGWEAHFAASHLEMTCGPSQHIERCVLSDPESAAQAICKIALIES